jgi:hypothetical protein
MLNVVMLIVVAQSTKLDCFKPDSLRFFAFWNRLPTYKVHEETYHLVHWELDCQKKIKVREPLLLGKAQFGRPPH